MVTDSLCIQDTLFKVFERESRTYNNYHLKNRSAYRSRICNFYDHRVSKIHLDNKFTYRIETHTNQEFALPYDHRVIHPSHNDTVSRTFRFYSYCTCSKIYVQWLHASPPSRCQFLRWPSALSLLLKSTIQPLNRLWDKFGPSVLCNIHQVPQFSRRMTLSCITGTKFLQMRSYKNPAGRWLKSAKGDTRWVRPWGGTGHSTRKFRYELMAWCYRMHILVPEAYWDLSKWTFEHSGVFQKSSKKRRIASLWKSV